MLLLFLCHEEENHTARDRKGNSDRIDDQVTLSAGLRQYSLGILDVNGRQSETRTAYDICTVVGSIAVGNLDLNRNDVGITVEAGRRLCFLYEILPAFEQHFFVLVVVESADTVVVGGSGSEGVVLRLRVSLGLIDCKLSARESIAFLVKLMNLNVKCIDIDLVAVYFAFDVVLISISQLDRLVRVTDRLGSGILVQNSGELNGKARLRSCSKTSLGEGTVSRILFSMPSSASNE